MMIFLGETVQAGPRIIGILLEGFCKAFAAFL
jgi:hypothetical protein